MELEQLPEHLIVLGSGYIGLEFAQMFHRFGSRVTVIGQSEQILSQQDRDIAIAVQNLLEQEGIEFFVILKVVKPQVQIKHFSLAFLTPHTRPDCTALKARIFNGSHKLRILRGLIR
ncbi:NAD-binding protein [[Phormidium] sp. LEGE 05292]|uniref:NAD-binding protein n=1 Tax=[Phormidium] sp. LEGE 05292 TaxID=767427 RepID=UPI001D150FB2|nr:NAD-binding protein [Phormidium sp. LEGE 05292]